MNLVLTGSSKYDHLHECTHTPQMHLFIHANLHAYAHAQYCFLKPKFYVMVNDYTIFLEESLQDNFFVSQYQAIRLLPMTESLEVLCLVAISLLGFQAIGFPIISYRSLPSY